MNARSLWRGQRLLAIQEVRAGALTHLVSPLMNLPEARRLLVKLLKLLMEMPDNGGIVVSPKRKRQRRCLPDREVLRGTQYIGVTKNANRFQAMLLVRYQKRYIGTYESAEEAARAFDKHSLWFRGLKVRGTRRKHLGRNKFRLHKGGNHGTIKG